MRDIIPKDDLQRLYSVEKKTDLDIAALYRCSKGTVYRTRKRFGILAMKRWERNQCEPSERQLQIMYGSLLGDGSISNGRKGKYKCQSLFEVQHCMKQKSYVCWKHNELYDLCRSNNPRPTSGSKWRLRTFHHPFFSELRNLWYPNGIKRLPDKQVLQKIGVLGLAVWYMDDGSLSKASNFIRLHTCNFSEQEHETLITWLHESFGIRSHMKIYSGYRNLVVDLDSRKAFVDLIRDHVIDEMKYKITFREYHTWAN